MSGTWDPGLSTWRDHARLLLGDTGQDSAPYLEDDTTYNGMLAAYPYDRAVGKLARGLAARYAQEPDWYDDDGGTKVRWLYRVQQWNRMADQYDPVTQSNAAVGTGFQYVASNPGLPDPQNVFNVSGSGGDTGMRF